ncbi:putative autophagy protein [Acaromyces ingoldii]|uniref:Autophagy-related protein n=1 Tax=Acaromyces ingoldii TaxID=215250 RepID=A0A316YWL4_9BASI|nr:putative autophagy protein [Acaromyces ingoldii]PWN93920.1 putative autophagy protein [Acaromyces ingoldii]
MASAKGPTSDLMQTLEDGEEIEPAKDIDEDQVGVKVDPVDEGEACVAPDQFDDKYQSSRLEIWSYYFYYVGENGLGPFNFGPTAFQNLLSIAAGDADRVLFFGALRSTNSAVLLANGVSCAINVVLFLLIGSLADFGTWRPLILIFWTVVGFALSMAWLGVQDASHLGAATALYIIGLIAYQMCLSFWTAAFPSLARNTVEMREGARALTQGEMTRKEYDCLDMMQRNRISNVAFAVQSAGELVVLAIIVGIMFAVDVDASQANNNRGLSILIAFTGAVWLLCAIPWFVVEKYRPGQPLPPNTNIFSAGLKQITTALREIWKLKQSLLYLVGYFVLSDALATTVTVIGTLQNTVSEFNTLTLTYLLIVGIAAQFIGISSFWLVQRRFQLSTKVMLNVVMVAIVLLDGWGMIGIWTQRFGFKRVYEFYLYQALYGLFVCPWYSYSLVMVSEITPRGREFLFFSLFGIVGKTSAFIGPICSSAIIDASSSGNKNLPFYFLFGLSSLSLIVLSLSLDLERSRREQADFLKAQNDKLSL